MFEQPPDDAVGRLQRVGADPDRLLVRCEARREVGAYEVGALHQHHRTGGPRVVERAHHAVGVEPDTERGRGVGLQQRGVDLPARHLAVAGHQRRHRGAPPGRGTRLGRARVRPVAVGHDTAGDAGARQLVTEQADLGAVELAVVAVDGLGDRHVHQPVAGRDAGAGREHVAGGVAPERLVDPEALATGRAVPHRPCAGTQGDVAARERRRPVDPVGDHGADGRLREQSIEVRRRGVVEVGPLGRGQRDDEHPAPRRRGRTGGRGADETDESDQSDHDGDQRGRADAPPPAWAHALTGSGSSLVFSP